MKAKRVTNSYQVSQEIREELQNMTREEEDSISTFVYDLMVKYLGRSPTWYSLRYEKVNSGTEKDDRIQVYTSKNCITRLKSLRKKVGEEMGTKVTMSGLVRVMLDDTFMTDTNESPKVKEKKPELMPEKTVDTEADADGKNHYKIIVSINGDDKNDGLTNGPVKTVERAIEVRNNLIEEHLPQIHIIIKDYEVQP